jgi:phage terminase large subunit-like protein
LRINVLASRQEARAKLARRRRKRVLPWEAPGLDRAGRVISFLEFLPITKGRLRGKKMRLLPEQRRFVEDIYRSDEVRFGILSMPRGNGKTGLAAGLTLCHLLGPEAEPRGACYSAAIDRQQAGILFEEMASIISQVAEFGACAHVLQRKKILVTGPGKKDGYGAHAVGSIYEALSADGRRGHGLSPSFWCYDELGTVKSRELFDNLVTAAGKRKRTLGLVISTQAADDEHSLSQLIDDAQTNADPTVVLHLQNAPSDADPFAEETIRAVNPALGIFLSERDILREAEQARRMPSFESAFRNRRLNQRIAAAHDLLVTPSVWQQGNGMIAEEIFRDGRPVYGGLDLSARLDLTAFVLGAEDDAGTIHLLPTAWTPEKTILARTQRDAAPYDAWVRNGQLRATPGLAIDYDFVLADIARITEGMNLVQVNYDSWNINALRQALARVGMSLSLQPFVQGWKSFSPAIAAFEVAATEGRIRHGAHPVLRWCMANTMTVRDAAGNRKPDKRRQYGRIDLAVAAIMAVGAMKISAEAPIDVAAMVA